MSGHPHKNPPDKVPLLSSSSLHTQRSTPTLSRSVSGANAKISTRTPSQMQTRRDLSTSPQKSGSQIPQGTAKGSSESTLPKLCEVCDLDNRRIWNCSYCDMNFCDDCWGKQGPHKPGRTGPDGLPHEKGDPNIVKRLRDILTPPTDIGEQQLLHVDDEDTTWFGIARNDNKQPIFQDYGRYANIMADSTTGAFKLRYPQLISFIGQTGAGKSTLVKMLIDQQERRNPHGHQGFFASPVVGSIRNENVPTSGDVHLYSDPQTYFEENPMLYADCEGLEGGENMPISAQYRNAALYPREKDRRPSHNEHRKWQKISKVARGTQRNLRWADSPEKSKRQYAVTELYPRLLYTFSDVIVFVLRNPKTFESTVLSKLIIWAHASLEKSLNQPTLPHAVIALNATDMEVYQQEWNPEYATGLLMASVADAIQRDPYYQGLAEFWKGRGKKVRTTKDLLECYYSSVTVVRIPVKGRYMKIDAQIDKLHKVLQEKSTESIRTKRRSRMLSNSEELNMYLQCAFDHFSQDLDTPFNFMDVAFRINPIPLDFGGNILKLAVAIKNCNRFNDPRNMFRELSYMVASCILLDCARQNLKGPAEHILEKAYREHCENALEDFCAILWPCNFTNKRGSRCVNVQERHTKGHQNEKGQIIGTGGYESDFTMETFAENWLEILQQHLAHFQLQAQQQMNMTPSLSELQVTTNHHRANAMTFYQRLGGAQAFFSNSACFCCLREMAEHPLPCGHVLCSPCIKEYGQSKDGEPGLYTLLACPLHGSEFSKFATPWGVHFKPALAGVRILSLDGGGIRGIVILEVLHKIEEEFGHGIRIQDFFDLIVGTSTGGILALGLGVKNWSVTQAIALFKRLVDKAFTHKLYGGIKIGKRKYRTGPLEEVLQEHFKDEPIFGGPHETPSSYCRKVAVTASSETGEQAVIISNYNRADDDHASYRLERPDNPEEELRLWEAARATSAAPTFFRPFVNSRTKAGYIDGAVFHNNPVQIANNESKFIWPDVEDLPPDILLSIGTGHNGSDTDGAVDVHHSDRRRHHGRKVLTKQPPEGRHISVPTLWVFPEVNSWINVLFKRVDNILDSEAIWRNFRHDVVGNTSAMHSLRYTRVNPSVEMRTPKMDDKSQFEKLHDDVSSRLLSTKHKDRIARIAYQLVASSFFFEKSGPTREAPGENHYVIQGTVCCRFARGSSNLRSLGRYIQRHQLRSFQPHFNVKEKDHRDKAQRVYITPEVIENMVKFSSFNVGPIEIPVSDPGAIVCIDLHLTNDKSKPHPWCGFPISGFPRGLDESEASKRAASLKSRASLESDRMTLAQKRATIRRSRTISHQPTSDHTNRLSGSIVDGTEYPDNANEVSDWVNRRLQARRPPPKPVQAFSEPNVFELYGSEVEGVRLDEDDEALLKAVERSEREGLGGMRRTNTGTDEDELEKVLGLSLSDH